MGLDKNIQARIVSLGLVPRAVQEFERLKKMTGLNDEQLLLNSLKLFRDLADAYEQGAEVYFQKPGIPPVKIARPY